MKKLFSIILFSALALVAGAQNAIRVEAPNLVSADEQFNLTFLIDGEHSASEFEWSGSDDFKVVWGPQKGSSTSISIVDGKRTKSVTSSYTYVLMPRAAGSFVIPSASAKVQGKTITSPATRIEVVQGGTSQGSSRGNSQQSAQGSGSSRSAASSGTIPDSDIYMRLIVNKNRVVVGEGVTATLKLYQRVNIAGFEDAKFPSFNGFWAQETQAPSNIEFHRENVGGEIYNTAVIRSWNLIPQKPGDITIDPAELVCLVNVRSSSSTGSIFDEFFQDNYRRVRKRVTTQPVIVHVSSLPAGAPASFGGGVGKFDMNASLSRDSLKAHDAASLIVNVSGRGNLSLLEAPKISFPPDFEVYDVKSSDNGNVRTFEYPFIPRSHGDFEIGPVEYSYYDIDRGGYVTLSSEPLAIKVERSAEELAQGTATGGQLVQSSRKDVRNLGSDIRYISTRTPQLRNSGSFFVFSPLYFVIVLLLLAAAALAWFFIRRADRRHADVAGSRNRAATKMARKRLALAGEYLDKNLYTAFYEELHKALLGFVSDKLNMDASDMSKENIAARLVEEGSGEALAAEFTGLLDACEYARYAPESGSEAMSAHYAKAVEVVSSIDSSMKKTVRHGAAGAAIAVLLCLLPMQGRANDAYLDSLWNAGVAAYSLADWDGAADAWGMIASTGMVSPELYNNLGNVAFRRGELGEAVLNYSRALKLDPSCQDARHNLDFVQERLQDRIDPVPEFFLKTFFRRLSYLLSSDAWAVVSLVLLAGLLGMLLIFLLGKSPSARKTGFFAGLAVLLCLIVSVLCASRQRRDYLYDTEAVVMRAVVSVKSSPGSTEAKDLFILHEGTVVKVLDSVGDWNNVRLADGREGWLQTDAVTII